MKCVILAAGYATRLYPLTENFPKPLLPVGEKTILDWLVDDIRTAKNAQGQPIVDEYVVISNHKYIRHFDEWAARRNDHITVVDDGTCSNEIRLGAVRDVQFAMEKLKLDSDLLVIAGDNVLDFSLTQLIDYGQKKQTTCIMRYHESDEQRLKKCGVVEVDTEDRILSMEEKPAQPRSHWCCPPFYYYTRMDSHRIAEGIAQGCGTDTPGSYIAWLSTKTVVHAMEMPGRRYDIGTLESYHRVQAEYRGLKDPDKR